LSGINDFRLTYKLHVCVELSLYNIGTRRIYARCQCYENSAKSAMSARAYRRYCLPEKKYNLFFSNRGPHRGAKILLPPLSV